MIVQCSWRGVQQSQAQPPTCSLGMFPEPQTLLAPCFPPCSAPHPQAEGTSEYGRGLLQSLEPQGPTPNPPEADPTGTNGAVLVTRTPEAGQ